MRRRVLRACGIAYPRELRATEGAELVDLAEDLAVHHGTLREALGLIRGGLAERRRQSGRRRRTTVALVAAAGSAVAVLSWSGGAIAGPARVEDERFACEGGCAGIAPEVQRRVDEGWTCTERREATSVTWRCVLD